MYWGRKQHGSVGLPVIDSSSRQDDAEVQRETDKRMKEYGGVGPCFFLYICILLQ
jgi:hypothetical protein